VRVIGEMLAAEPVVEDETDVEIYVWCWKCCHPAEALDGRLCACCGADLPKHIAAVYYEGTS
jgi:hypothetical protein